MVYLFFKLFTFATVCLRITVKSESECRNEALGMESGLIPDVSITASSSHDLKSVGPQNSRIRKEQKGGAWCPRGQVSGSSYEWLQVDLGRIHLVSAIETQGRHGNGDGAEFVPAYRLEYKRYKDSALWQKYRNSNKSQIIPGNTNTNDAYKHILEHSIVARWLRVVPFSVSSQTVCLRVEFYGCPREDGLVTYNTSYGDSISLGVRLSDTTYDGDILDGNITNGLGILVDDDEGDPDFMFESSRGWVGWSARNKSRHPSCRISPCPVEISFAFDSIRSFDEVVISCFCSSVKQTADVFTEAWFWFSFEEGHSNQHPYICNSSSFVIIPPSSTSLQVSQSPSLLVSPTPISSPLSSSSSPSRQPVDFLSSILSSFFGGGNKSSSSLRREISKEMVILTPSSDRLEEFSFSDSPLNSSNPHFHLLPTTKTLIRKYSQSTKPSSSSMQSTMTKTTTKSSALQKFTSASLSSRKFSSSSMQYSPSPSILPSLSPVLLLSSSAPPLSSSSSLCRVRIPLNQYLAKYIRMRLHFKSDWLIMSEIKFISKTQNAFVLKKESYSHAAGDATMVTSTTRKQDGKRRGGSKKIPPSRKQDDDSPPSRKQDDDSPKNNGRESTRSSNVIIDFDRSPKLENVAQNLDRELIPSDSNIANSNDNTVIRSTSSNNTPSYLQIVVVVVLVAVLLASLAVVFSALFLGWKRKKMCCKSNFKHDKGGCLQSVAGKADEGMVIVDEDKIMLQIGKVNGKEFVYFNSKNLCPTQKPDLRSCSQQELSSRTNTNNVNNPSNTNNSSSTYHLYNPTFFPFNQQQLFPPKIGNNNDNYASTLLQTNASIKKERNNKLDSATYRIVPKQNVDASNSNFHSNTADRCNDVNNYNHQQQQKFCSRKEHVIGSPPVGSLNVNYLIEDVKCLSIGLKEYSSDNFELVENIGNAEFGPVDLCALKYNTMQSISKHQQHDTYNKSLAATTSLAVVLNLNNFACDKTRINFLQEVKKLLQLNDTNILKVGGLCFHDNRTLSVVMETVTWRDMCQFLMESTTEPGTTERGSGIQIREAECDADGKRSLDLRFLSLGCLTHLGCQVASGMKYLEKCGLVHGDLSARNCLVGPKRHVKICDLAKWRSIYREDYYTPPHPNHQQQHPSSSSSLWSLLPVRWMAWEAILLNQVSSKTDVWSFGVTLWEILSLARVRPYNWLSDQQLFEIVLAQQGSDATQNVGQHFDGNSSSDIARSTTFTGSFSPQQHCWQQSQRFFKQQPLSYQAQQLREFRQTLQNPSTDEHATNFSTKPQQVAPQQITNSQLKQTQKNRSTKNLFLTLQQDQQQQILVQHPQQFNALLPQPIGCPKEVYDLLIECWNQDSNRRPSFSDIHLFLMRYYDGHPNTPKNVVATSTTMPATLKTSQQHTANDASKEQEV